MTTETISWGIIGSGRIARHFGNGVGDAANARLAAVAGRTPGNATALRDELAARHGDVTAYDNYEALLADDGVEAVYIANTHNFHHECILMALDAGKHVLCEKPLTVNAEQARECINHARGKKLFLMEGMWTRFLPAIVQARQWLDDCLIGEVHHVNARFGWHGKWGPEHRMLNPDLAGGALLDVGIYPLAFASMVAKGAKPQSIQAQCIMGETGVDVDDTILLAYPNALTAVAQCSFTTDWDGSAIIAGSKGRIEIPKPFHATTQVRLVTQFEETVKRFPFPPRHGFRFEIEAASTHIANGDLESPVMSLDETLTLAETMDEVRRQCGLRYPGE